MRRLSENRVKYPVDRYRFFQSWDTHQFPGAGRKNGLFKSDFRAKVPSLKAKKKFVLGDHKKVEHMICSFTVTYFVRFNSSL